MRSWSTVSQSETPSSCPTNCLSVLTLYCSRLMCILPSALLYKGAETGNGPAHNERVHFACAFVGVNRFGIGHEAPHLVVEQDAIARQQFAGIAHRLAHLHGAEGFRQRRVFVAHDSGILHLR